MSLRKTLLALFVLVVLAALGFLAYLARPQPRPPLTASGTIEAEELAIAAELSGRVARVAVAEGDEVQAGQVLFVLDDSLLQAQYDQAQAALEAARAQLRLAQAQAEVARRQYDLARQQAHQAAAEARVQAWFADAPNAFDLPLWYFTADEARAAAQAEVDAAAQSLAEARANLEHLQTTLVAADLRAAEEALARARAEYQAAQAVLDRAEAQNDAALRDQAQARLDAARNALEAAQAEYDRLLTQQQAQDLLEARAQVAVAQERYDAALDRWYALQWGDAAPQVRLAEAQKAQAEAAVAQAEAAVAQAEAQVRAIEVQMDKLTVTAPVAGVVTAHHVRVGEVLRAGVPALTLGQLDRLTITVYIPEDRLGDLRLGQQASLTVDAFPGETFYATVSRIADRAEYTPRNVQTVEGRKTMVFAVELRIDDPSGRLKPGMPADVHFEE